MTRLTEANGGSNITNAPSKDAVAFLSASDLLSRFRRKELSPVEVMRAVLDRIDRHNSAVNAWCHLDAEGALRSAKDSEARWMAGTQPVRFRISDIERLGSG